MTPKRKLNERQLAVLRRIADGIAPITSEEWDLARTVYALRDRKLVTTSRGDGMWTAHITDAGQFFVAHGHYPDKAPGPAVQQRGRRQSHVLPRDLLTQLHASDGTLRISDPDQATVRTPSPQRERLSVTPQVGGGPSSGCCIGPAR